MPISVSKRFLVYLSPPNPLFQGISSVSCPKLNGIICEYIFFETSFFLFISSFRLDDDRDGTSSGDGMAMVG